VVCRKYVETESIVLQPFYDCETHPEATSSTFFQLATEIADLATKKNIIHESLQSNLAWFIRLLAINAQTCHSVEGVGLFPTISLVNHSCQPNAVYVTKQEGSNTVCVLRALKRIEANEVICISYLDLRYLLYPRSLRQSLLHIQKNFMCQCDGCVAEPDMDPRDEKIAGLLLNNDLDAQSLCNVFKIIRSDYGYEDIPSFLTPHPFIGWIAFAILEDFRKDTKCEGGLHRFLCLALDLATWIGSNRPGCSSVYMEYFRHIPEISEKDLVRLNKSSSLCDTSLQYKCLSCATMTTRRCNNCFFTMCCSKKCEGSMAVKHRDFCLCVPLY